MIGCGIYISCGVTKKNKNTGGNEHMCGLEFLEFHCHRIFFNGYIHKLFSF